MKNFIVIAIEILSAFIVWYLIGCFIAWDINIANWSNIGRVLYIIASIYSANKLVSKE